MESFDTVIIGGGPGGTPAAMRLAQNGKRVILVEERGRPGGECLFEGCIPSKILEHAAHRYSLLEGLRGPDKGINDKPSAIWKRFIEKKDRLLELRSDAALRKFENLPTLTFVAGKARFRSNREVVISEGSGKERTIGFKNAIIATGSGAFVPPVKGNGLQYVWTNRGIFEAHDLPASIVIIGGGAIGIEFAQMLSKLGVKCTLIEMLDRILPPVEEEFAGLLHRKMCDEDGIEVNLSSRVLEINFADEKFEVVFEDKGGETHSIVPERVLMATGRIPNTKGLNLESAGVSSNRKGIETDEFLETTAQGIYAVGDVINGPKFAHTATYESLTATENILHGNAKKVDFTKNSWVLFSDPEIASAGLTEDEALRAGRKIIIGRYDFSSDAKAQINGHPFGFLKFVVERETLQILGVHIFTKGAPGISGEAALIVSMGATLKDVSEAVHPHPTMTEGFGLLARQMLGTIKENSQ